MTLRKFDSNFSGPPVTFHVVKRFIFSAVNYTRWIDTVRAVATDCVVSAGVFLSVSTITHEPLHAAWWNFEHTCTSATSRALLNFKVKGQGHMGFRLFFGVRDAAATHPPADSTLPWARLEYLLSIASRVCCIRPETCIALHGTSELRSVTCHMWSHSVTCHPTQVSAPRLNPSHAGRYSIYLPRRDGRLSWPCYSETQPPGVELATSRSRIQRPNHWSRSRRKVEGRRARGRQRRKYLDSLCTLHYITLH